MDNNFKGKLLVAKPHVMRDPFFQKSVVYIYEQQGEVVLGLILNKPTNMTTTDVNKLRGTINSGAVAPLYRGGPVSEQSLLMIHTDDWSSTNTLDAKNGLLVSSDELMLEKLAMENLPKCWRLMSGMSTWVIPQLQTEIYRHKAWLVIDPNKQIFFDTDGEEQWKASIDLASHRMMETFF
jgi:putative transcriptional regulator|tara:strand:- start:1478 stop:2017 length:540 start_codon:yes stop_codon:yes gene_type:complete